MNTSRRSKNQPGKTGTGKSYTASYRCTRPMPLRLSIPVFARWQSAEPFLTTILFSNCFIFASLSCKKVGRPLCRQPAACPQSASLEWPPRRSFRQIRPLIFPTYTIRLTLPNLYQSIFNPSCGYFTRISLIKSISSWECSLGWWCGRHDLDFSDSSVPS